MNTQRENTNVCCVSKEYTSVGGARSLNTIAKGFQVDLNASVDIFSQNTTNTQVKPTMFYRSIL